jgi:hypothetical protein
MNLNIFNINYNNLVQQLLPPMLRKQSEIAWLTSLTEPLQTNNVIFNEYITGSTYPYWLSSSGYTSGDTVIYKSDNNVYTSISASTGQLPSTGTTYWTIRNDNYIGAYERARYNSQKIIYELALNRWFNNIPNTPMQYSGWTGSNHTTDIYIQNLSGSTNIFIMGESSENSSLLVNDSSTALDFMATSYSGDTFYNYKIWVPNSIYTATTDNIIRSYADKVNLSSKLYTIAAY